jgi:hypothetical protein
MLTNSNTNLNSFSLINSYKYGTAVTLSDQNFEQDILPKDILSSLVVNFNDINFNRVIPVNRFFEYNQKDRLDQVPEISNMIFKNIYTGKISIFVFQVLRYESDLNSIIKSSLVNKPKIAFSYIINEIKYDFDGSISRESIIDLVTLSPKWFMTFLGLITSKKNGKHFYDLDILLSVIVNNYKNSLKHNMSVSSAVLVPSLFNKDLQYFFFIVPNPFIKDRNYKISEEWDKYVLDVSYPQNGGEFFDFWEEWKFDGSITSETFSLMNKYYDDKFLMLFKSLKELSMFSDIKLRFLDWYCYLIAKIMYFERLTFDLNCYSINNSWNLRLINLRQDSNFDWDYHHNIDRIESILGYVIPVYYEAKKEEKFTGKYLEYKKESEKKSKQLMNKLKKIQNSSSKNLISKRKYGTLNCSTLILLENLRLSGMGMSRIEHFMEINRGFKPSLSAISYKQDFNPKFFSERNIYHGNFWQALAKSRNNLWPNFTGAGFRIHNFKVLDDLPTGFVNSLKIEKSDDGRIINVREEFNSSYRSFFPISGLRPEEIIQDLDNSFDLKLSKQVDAILESGKHPTLIINSNDSQMPFVLVGSELSPAIFINFPNSEIFQTGSLSHVKILDQLNDSMVTAYKSENGDFELVSFSQFDKFVVNQELVKLEEAKQHLINMKNGPKIQLVDVPFSIDKIDIISTKVSSLEFER